MAPQRINRGTWPAFHHSRWFCSNSKTRHSRGCNNKSEWLGRVQTRRVKPRLLLSSTKLQLVGGRGMEMGMRVSWAFLKSRRISLRRMWGRIEGWLCLIRRRPMKRVMGSMQTDGKEVLIKSRLSLSSLTYVSLILTSLRTKDLRSSQQLVGADFTDYYFYWSSK